MPGRNVSFVPEGFYHLYNRGNNRETIFFERDNYGFFLQRIRSYRLPPVEIPAHCLTPNPYHLLIRVRDETLGVLKTPEV